jgi:hypothetical protein
MAAAHPSAWRDGRAFVALLGAMYVPAALQALALPRSFFDDFPLGRGWIAAAGGAYNEHLVRDVGALFLALVITSLWTVRDRALVTPVAVAWLALGVLHAGFHSEHLDRLSGVDQVLLSTTLLAVPILSIAAIASARRSQRRRDQPLSQEALGST